MQCDMTTSTDLTHQHLADNTQHRHGCFGHLFRWKKEKIQDQCDAVVHAVDEDVRRVSMDAHWRAKSIDTMDLEVRPAIHQEKSRRSEDFGGAVNLLYS